MMEFLTNYLMFFSLAGPQPCSIVGAEEKCVEKVSDGWPALPV